MGKIHLPQSLENVKHVLIFLISVLAMAGHAQDNQGEKQHIIQTLTDETKYFYARNLDDWQDRWSRKSFVSKMYIISDTYTGDRKFKEFKDWNAIKKYTLDYFEEHPNPVPAPESNLNYKIHLFGDAAYVLYSYKGASGEVRETRFIVKENGEWKIARMQTIY